MCKASGIRFQRLSVLTPFQHNLAIVPQTAAAVERLFRERMRDCAPLPAHSHVHPFRVGLDVNEKLFPSNITDNSQDTQSPPIELETDIRRHFAGAASPEKAEKAYHASPRVVKHFFHFQRYQHNFIAVFPPVGWKP